MSQEQNVDVVRRCIRECELKRDELPTIVAEFWDADGDYYPVRKFPDTVPRHGREEFTLFMVQFHETWDRFENPVKELIAVGDDRILACTTMRAEGPGSGIRIEGDLYNCVWLRHGLIFRWEDHLTLHEALHALGLDGETLNEAGLLE